jgi:hypothetical protein
LTKSLLFTYNPALPDAYEVQNSVTADVLGQFLDSLAHETKIVITPANVSELLLLSQEFGVSELVERCAAFSVPCPASLLSDGIATKCDREFKSIYTRFQAVEGCIVGIRNEIRQLRAEATDSAQRTQNDLENVKLLIDSKFTPLEVLVGKLRVDMNFAKEKLSHMRVEIERPMYSTVEDGSNSLQGIISYLTGKLGNVHTQEIVTITSKSSGPNNPAVRLTNLADFSEATMDGVLCFWSENEPGQWICWDFHCMRVKLTAYGVLGIVFGGPQSWFVEGSVDGVNWTEIDEQAYDPTMRNPPARIRVESALECRFVRLTQTGKNAQGGDQLRLRRFELFGTLIE